MLIFQTSNDHQRMRMELITRLASTQTIKTLNMASLKKDDIIDFVRKINEIWIEGNTEELYNYLSNDVVFASPGFNKYLKGKDLCVNSYREFIGQALVRDFQTSQYNVDLFNDIAIATYQFEIDYLLNDQEYKDHGFEIMAFRQVDNQLLLIWRTQMPMNL